MNDINNEIKFGEYRERERENNNSDLLSPNGEDVLKNSFCCPGGWASWRGCEQIIKDGKGCWRKGSFLCLDCIKFERKVAFWIWVTIGSIIGVIVLGIIVLMIIS